jgi:hypothetical protein
MFGSPLIGERHTVRSQYPQVADEPIQAAPNGYHDCRSTWWWRLSPHRYPLKVRAHCVPAE